MSQIVVTRNAEVVGSKKLGNLCRYSASCAKMMNSSPDRTASWQYGCNGQKATTAPPPTLDFDPELTNTRPAIVQFCDTPTGTVINWLNERDLWILIFHGVVHSGAFRCSQIFNDHFIANIGYSAESIRTREFWISVNINITELWSTENASFSWRALYMLTAIAYRIPKS